MSTTWWPTTWGKLAPGDAIQAPNGSEWRVASALEYGDVGEWLITSGSKSLWSPHRLDEPVSAARPPVGRDPQEFARAEVLLGRLRMAFGDVEPLQPTDTGPVDAPRWLGCGQRGRCVCRR